MTAGQVAGALGSAWAATSAPEACGAALGVLYVVLAIRQHRACWIAALASTVLYLHVFYAARLYMQAGLQLYYIGMAVYGWWAWRAGEDGAVLGVTRTSGGVQAAGLAAVVVGTALSAQLLGTVSAEPLLDALTTWASVFATWLMARKRIDNWAWWLVIDVLISVLCWRTRLFASMILYGLYVGLILIGWVSWYRDMQRQAPSPASGR